MNRSCVKPTTHFELLGRVSPTGKRVFVSQAPRRHTAYREASRPCGACVACRVSRRLDLALRLSHESQMHDWSWFVTLTYDEERVPYGNTVLKSHAQKFIRSLRKRSKAKWRFFIVSEYGEKFSRPHYHAILFGPRLRDLRFLYCRDGNDFFESDLLTEAWGRGFVEVSTVSPSTMMYVTKYHVEKVTGDRAADHYSWLVESTGEFVDRSPEFALMSTRPGIGASWFARYWSDCYPKGFVTSKGIRYRPPRYYDLLLERRDPELFAEVKAARLEHLPSLGELLQERLDAKAACALAELELKVGKRL